MIITGCEFNPDVDLHEVDQFGYVDINEAFYSGSVIGDLNVDEQSYNDIDDPRSVGFKPRDHFEAIEYGRHQLRRGQVKSDPSSQQEQEG